MLAKYLLSSAPQSFLGIKLLTARFTTATKIDYYSMLDVASSATEEAIRNAYADLTRGIHPDTHPHEFKKLNEAFVILTDSKARDAYDSLLKVRKQFYLNDNLVEQVKNKSYWAERREKKLEELKKKLNIDDFGRYKGGLPNKRGLERGKAVNNIGEMHTQEDIEEALDCYPDFPSVSEEKAESFKNYHAGEREARTMKWPWFTFEVDYEYFNLKRKRRAYWPLIKFCVYVVYILPIFGTYIQAKWQLHESELLKEKYVNKLKEEEQAKSKPAVPAAQHTA